jgi:Flp pilus assembly protein TadG
MRKDNEKGQAIIFLVLALGIFLIGAIGLAIDGAQLFAQQRMAQAAADAAAQAGILSIYNGTNIGTNAFGSAAHTCGTADPITPCSYARKNGFGASATEDEVYLDYPDASAIGMDPTSLSTETTPNILRVTITRNVDLGLIRMLGAGRTAPIKAVAAAAVVSVQSPTPLIITHPSLDHSLSTNGTTNIQICGGPSKSIQVNSTSPIAFAQPKAGGTIDLSRAGTADPGNCTTGTGADFGTSGGATNKPSSVLLGSTGHYWAPSSYLDDPFRNVPAPSVPPNSLPPTDVYPGTYNCSNQFSRCRVYTPGLYTGGLDTSSVPSNYGILFAPGLYYMRGGGFALKNVMGGGGAAESYNAMCTGCPSNTDTGTGMLVYDSGPAGSSFGNNRTGGFDINTNVSATLLGPTLMTTNNRGEAVPAPPYYNILFWEDRMADKHVGSNPPTAGGAHSLGQGNGCFSLIGTIYATNTRDDMIADPTHYQEVNYNGNPCSTTVQQGYIVVSSLQIVGTTTIRMKLLPFGFMTIQQVALVR